MEGESEYSDQNAPLLPPHTQQATKALALLLFFSFLMFSLPFGAFFGTRYFLKEHTDVTDYAATVWSVIAAVITIYLIIFGYAYIAYYEQEYDDEGNPIIENANDTKDSNLKED